MVLDDDVLEAVLDGDVDAVEAWLAADPSRTVNDFAYEGLLRAGRATMLSFLLRSLVSRGRALPARVQRRRPRGRDARQDRAILLLCKMGDNGVVWKILEFWCAAR